MSYPSVVRIFATTQDPDYDSPWQSHTPCSGTGSGVVIAPNRILTGAHVVADATFVQVQKVSDPAKAIARVEAICHDCDLALLAVESPGFMDGVVPPEIGGLPSLRDRVSVVGYPVGGDEISVTEGVVSRVEVQRYRHSQRHLLAVTVDAAINDGNSGGPAYLDGKVVGIAFQTLNNAENVGELVPVPLIRHFLRMVEQGVDPVVPGLALTTQSLENPALRARLGMPEERTGVLVCSVEYGGSAWGVLQPGDALLSIAGERIANNGTIQYQNRYRTRFDVMLGHFAVGDPLVMEVWRAGSCLTLTVTLAPQVYLAPRSCYERAPRYFVYAGMVFQPLSRDFLSTWTDWWDRAPKEFLHLYYSGVRTESLQEVVVISQMLADEINVGYEDLYGEVVTEVNGHPVRDLRDLVERIETSHETMEVRTTSDQVAVYDCTTAKEANERILNRYHIAADRSPDLHDGSDSGEPS